MTSGETVGREDLVDAIRARVGAGSDDNIFRAPSEPYIDFADPADRHAVSLDRRRGLHAGSRFAQVGHQSRQQRWTAAQHARRGGGNQHRSHRRCPVDRVRRPDQHREGGDAAPDREPHRAGMARRERPAAGTGRGEAARLPGSSGDPGRERGGGEPRHLVRGSLQQHEGVAAGPQRLAKAPHPTTPTRTLPMAPHTSSPNVTPPPHSR